jgi:N-acetylmuramoyl-L-alanine amidase
MRRPQGAARRRGDSFGRLTRVIAVACLFVAGAVVLSGLWHGVSLPDSFATVPLSLDDRSTTSDETSGDTRDVLAAVVGRNALSDPPGYLRIPRPQLPPGPRRVGIQAGHWLTAEAPPELRRLEVQTGASWGAYTEWEINLDIAQRVGTLLRKQGLAVDILPTTIPEGYVADAFIALHADSDGFGELSGFKTAHSPRRGPYEDALEKDLTDAYAAETGLVYDGTHITRAMTFYYGMSWTRFRHATSPFTPSVILEMGYLSNDDDRDLMMRQANAVAVGIANGVLNFLSAHPRSELFAKDLLVPPAPIFRPATPTPSPSGQ